MPWFEHYKDAAALDGGAPLKGVDSVAALGINKGELPLPDNSPLAPANVKKLGSTNIVPMVSFDNARAAGSPTSGSSSACCVKS